MIAAFNWRPLKNSQNSVRKKSFGGTFCFSNCHIIRLYKGGLKYFSFNFLTLAGSNCPFLCSFYSIAKSVQDYINNIYGVKKDTNKDNLNRPGHSGSSLDINFFFFNFFVLYVSFNLSNDVFEGKKLFFP
jgi:hypothetical protein